MIGAYELCKATGATYRQVDYWCAMGVIPTIGKVSPGSGIDRKFDEEIIEKVALLAKVSKIFPGRPVGKDILRQIFENYEEGEIILGEGIVLRWEI